MRRRAWTRLRTLAVATGLLVDALLRSAAHVRFAEFLVIVEAAGALLLLRSRTRPIGMMIGAAAAALATSSALLSAQLGSAPAPTLQLGGLLLLGRRMEQARADRARRIYSPMGR